MECKKNFLPERHRFQGGMVWVHSHHLNCKYLLENPCKIVLPLLSICLQYTWNILKRMPQNMNPQHTGGIQ